MPLDEIPHVRLVSTTLLLDQSNLLLQEIFTVLEGELRQVIQDLDYILGAETIVAKRLE